MIASPENSAIDSAKDASIISLSISSSDDVKEISRIENNSFSDPWSEDSIKEVILADASVCVTAKLGNAIVGYGFMYVVSDESELVNIAVKKEERRRGVARRILIDLTERARELGADITYLEVRSSNRSAEALYNSLGFEKIGIRKNYYRYPTEDALVMAKILTDDGA